jgi:hypothetical protein
MVAAFAAMLVSNQMTDRYLVLTLALMSSGVWLGSWRSPWHDERSLVDDSSPETFDATLPLVARVRADALTLATDDDGVHRTCRWPRVLPSARDVREWTVETGGRRTAFSASFGLGVAVVAALAAAGVSQVANADESISPGIVTATVVSPEGIADDLTNAPDAKDLSPGSAEQSSARVSMNGPGGTPSVAFDFDGNGSSDRAVFRPEVGGWYIEGQTTQYLGLAGDVPVPGDYDGDGTTDAAVFRDGVWYVSGQATVFLGVAGDVPVPGDYDGDGATDAAVFRDGVWYIDRQATKYFGAVGDVPVPADFDGDGVTDAAVFRPAVGGWYVDGQSPVFFGLSSDVPVPADFDGDGTTDRAVFRPEYGGWYVDGQSPVFVGLSSDVPVPADYDGAIPLGARRLSSRVSRLDRPGLRARVLG